MKKVSKTTFVAVFSLAVLAAVSLITLINHGTDGVVNVSNETLNNMVNPLGGPTESTAGTTDVQPATTVDMTPVAKAVKEVGAQSNAAIERQTEAINRLASVQVQSRSDAVKLNVDEKKQIKTGLNVFTRTRETKKLSKRLGHKKAAEAVFFAMGANEEYFGEVAEFYVDQDEDSADNMATTVTLNKEVNEIQNVAIEKNIRGVKNVMGITFENDPKLTSEQRLALIEKEYDAGNGILLKQSDQSGRKSFRDQLTAAYEKADKAERQYVDGKIRTLQVKKDGSMETSVTKPIIWAVQ